MFEPLFSFSFIHLNYFFLASPISWFTCFSSLFVTISVPFVSLVSVHFSPVAKRVQLPDPACTVDTWASDMLDSWTETQVKFDQPFEMFSVNSFTYRRFYVIKSRFSGYHSHEQFGYNNSMSKQIRISFNFMQKGQTSLSLVQNQ